MYIQRTYDAGHIIAVHKTYSRKHGAGISRQTRGNKTPDAVAKYNRKMREREVAWVAHQNFRPGKDIHLNFTYAKGSRPDPEQAKKDFSKALNILRKGMKKTGVELKYISALGVGEKNGIHLHLITNCADMELLRKAWPHGGIHIEPLYANGNYSGLAVYFVNQEKENGRLKLKIVGRWSCSRNLIRKEPEAKEIRAFSWREPPVPKKGYLIDIDSLDPGENPVTGIPYLFYRMVKIPDKTPSYDRERLVIENSANIKEKWKNKFKDTGLILPAKQKSKNKKAKKGGKR